MLLTIRTKKSRKVLFMIALDFATTNHLKGYNSFKILFSPLVSSNQSATWFDYNGFKEAHVNFPFIKKDNLKSMSKEAALVSAGSILFTELNHAFINPKSEKPQYTARIHKALSNLSKWNDPEKSAKYYNDAYSCFNEYMNWGVVCLRYIDYAPKKDQPPTHRPNRSHDGPSKRLPKIRRIRPVFGEVV